LEPYLYLKTTVEVNKEIGKVNWFNFSCLAVLIGYLVILQIFGEYISKLGLIKYLQGQMGTDGSNMAFISYLLLGLILLIICVVRHVFYPLGKEVYIALAKALYPLQPSFDELNQIRTMMMQSDNIMKRAKPKQLMDEIYGRSPWS
jgi:hypothetical protein